MLQPSDYSSLETLVFQKTGLKVDKSRYPELARLVDAMLETAGMNRVHDLLDTLSKRQTADPLWRQLIGAVTIGETYFFRDSAQCSALQNSVLPELINKRRASGFRHLSLWSAGCATGEEPYTLAILLRELIPDIAEWTFSLLGTDINQASLDFARHGVYRARSFRDETRSDVQERWFTAHDGGCELDPAVRKMVAFAPLNLVSDNYPSFETRTMNLDLIICRNVTIYFDEATTRRVIERFHQALNEGGWLVVGHAEPMASLYEGFTPRNFPNAVLYQKEPNKLPVMPVVPVKPVSKPAATVDHKPREITAVQPRPQAPVNAVQEARAAAGREDWTSAQRWLAIAERNQPMNPQVYYLRGLIFMHTGDDDEAFYALRRAVYCDTSFALAHYALGELYEKHGNGEEARRCWLRCYRIAAGRPPQDILVPGEDLTVEMFCELLTYRLGVVLNGGHE